ncbi:hypothetical protein N356_gp049 [Cellulophaga phage phi14:2]|uniref:Nuclease-associated modular DNA-binding 1 domain-containing protein n=1 Tax=Cellulophaga phage phi14:2 TaxID=1327990 RepID=S0A0P2_9CAUD|nr:hypothetical protein N356_gp049 [Cellulophaga phage phi14:2]AGO48941.1 hypothetical protein Phi14:2_gp063 [Cellulophaga phage phi14:2]
MSRPKYKVFIYDDDGKYLGDFPSMTEFAHTYNLSKNCLVNSDKNYHLFDDGRIAVLERMGRDKVRQLKSYISSPYVGKNKSIALGHLKDKLNPIKLYDLDGDLIATFENSFVMSKLTSLPTNYKNGTLTRDGLKIVIEDERD